MKSKQPRSKLSFDIMSVQSIESPISYDEYAVRLARVAEAQYSLLTSSVSFKNSSKNPAGVTAGFQSSSIHLHETLETRALVCLRDVEVDHGKDDPKTAE